MPNDSTLLITFEPRNLGGCAKVVSTSITFKLQADIRDHVHKRDTNSSAPKWYAHSYVYDNHLDFLQQVYVNALSSMQHNYVGASLPTWQHTKVINMQLFYCSQTMHNCF